MRLLRGAGPRGALDTHPPCLPALENVIKVVQHQGSILAASTLDTIVGGWRCTVSRKYTYDPVQVTRNKKHGYCELHSAGGVCVGA
jgi:hypothetical protein